MSEQNDRFNKAGELPCFYTATFYSFPVEKSINIAIEKTQAGIHSADTRRNEAHSHLRIDDNAVDSISLL